MTIERFRGDNYFLSNMYFIDPPGGITVGNLVVHTIEQLYKASRFVDIADKDKVLTAPNGFAAKGIADSLESHGAKLRGDWESIRLPVMRASVALKFGQNPDLADALIKTGDEELVEGMKGDRYSFWGVAPIGSRNGLNWLGRILMDTRGLLQSSSDDSGIHPERLLIGNEVLAPEGITSTPEQYMVSILFSQAA